MAILKNLTINDTGYLQVSSGTIAQRPSSPAEGMFRYNTDLKVSEYYNGSEWATTTGTNSIIQNGLVLWLDAGIPSSYSGSGTTWTDLSGNGNNVTLTNGPTYNSSNGGYISFDGTDDFANFFAPSLSGTATIEMWARVSAWGGMIMGWAGYDVYTDGGRLGYNTGNSDIYGISSANVSSLGLLNNWKHYVFEMRSDVSYTNNKIYINGVSQTLSQQLGSEGAGNRTFNSGNGRISGWRLDNGYRLPMNCSVFKVYNRALTQQEILQNYNTLRYRFGITQFLYDTLTYTASATITVTGNSTTSVSFFKTSGTAAWDSQAYSSTPYTAPCTIEFTKQAAATDNGVSYAMIGWNTDPTTDASYTSLDYAAYPYNTNTYSVYNNGSQVLFSGAWSTSSKFYIVYDTDGYIRHYNGSTLLYSVSYGTGNTVYVDSSLYSVNSTYGGFSDVRVCKFSWNGTRYNF